MPKAKDEKRQYRVMQAISWRGDRVPRGSVIDLSVHDAKGLPEGYLEPIRPDDDGEAAAPADGESAAGEEQPDTEGKEIDV